MWRAYNNTSRTSKQLPPPLFELQVAENDVAQAKIVLANSRAGVKK